MAASLLSGIYAITHVASGRIYIGSAANIQKRWSIHRHHLEHGTHHCHWLQHAWAKYGADAFAFTVLEEVHDTAHLFPREQAWIDASPRLFNTARVAEGGWAFKHSEATIRRMSRSAIAANTPDVRRKKSEAQQRLMADPEYAAQRRELSAAFFRGKTHTEESRAKMRTAAKNRVPQSEETRRKRAETMRERKPSQETRQKLSDANRLWARTEDMRKHMSEGQRERAARGDFTRGPGGRFVKAEPSSPPSN